MTISASPTFAFSGFHHINITIPVGGEDLSRNFWGAILGMVEIEKPPLLATRAGCWFRAGAVEIHLSADINFLPEEKAHPGILIANLRKFAEHLESHQVALRWDEEFPAFQRFYATDPFGNRLEFMQPK